MYATVPHHKNHANFSFVTAHKFRKLYSVAEIGYKTPSELRRGVEELRDNWNLLRNQVLGRGVSPRPDLPESVTSLVGEYFNSFRKWYDHISKSFVKEMFGLYNEEFQTQLARYEKAHQISKKALSTLPKREKLKAPGMEEFQDRSTITPWIVAAVAVGFAVYMWNRKQS